MHGIDRYLDNSGEGVHEPGAAVFMRRIEHGFVFGKGMGRVQEANPKRCFTSA
jgi:hypothetical protein